MTYEEFQLKDKVWAAACKGVPVEEIASECGISVPSVINIAKEVAHFIERRERMKREDERDLSNFSKN